MNQNQMLESEVCACQACKTKERKKELNKKDYTKHAPFPVRLGVLKEIIMQDALDKDVSAHSLMIKAIELAYAPQLDVLSKSINIHFDEVASLVKAGYDLNEVTKELKIDTKLFLRGLTPDQSKTMEVLLRRSRFEQKGLFDK